MRPIMLQVIKSEIENSLRQFLREEGIELYIAANDNPPPLLGSNASVELESIEDMPMADSALLSEIRIILGVLGRSRKCEMLINGIYQALHPHHITQRELSVLLMSMHVEEVHCTRPRYVKKRAIMRYIVEEITPEAANENFDLFAHFNVDAEYC